MAAKPFGARLMGDFIMDGKDKSSEPTDNA